MRRLRALVTGVGLAWAGHAAGRNAEPPAVELAESVTRRLESSFLTPEEASALRLFHGVWRESDIASPRARAQAALQRGAITDASLSSAEALPTDRAAGALARGETARVLEILDGDESIPALRLRAEALAAAGRPEEARRVLDRVAAQLARTRIDDAETLVAGARALVLRSRLVGPESDASSEYRAIAALLARARDELDRMSWPAHIAEAELLLDKDNPAEAQQAALDALRLNPNAADAWLLLGRMAVSAFDFDSASDIADRLEQLSASMGEDVGAGATVIRARARLRQGDADGAAEMLDAALEALPAHRELLALRAAAAAARHDEGDLAGALARLESVSPGGAEGELLVGQTLSEMRQYDRAASHLRRAHERAPKWAAPLVELGLLEVQAGRDDEAREALQAAASLDPFNVRAGNSLTLLADLATYATIEGEHFIIRYKPGIDEVLAREMMPVLDAVHARVCGGGAGGIAFSPPGKTRIELMPDHASFSVRISGMPRIHTMAASTGPVIAMESPREGPGHPIGLYDWPRVIQHEYTHTVTLARTNNRIPHWFTEAAAVYLEDAPRPSAWIGLLAETLRHDALFDLSRINIAFVRPKGPNDRTLAYAQGHWMYSFMVERFGADAPLRLMDEYAGGRTQAAAFADVLGMSEASFLESFKRWARAQVIAWGLLLPEGVPTLRDLRRALDATPGAPAAPTLAHVDAWLREYPGHPEVTALGAELARRDARGEVTETVASRLEAMVMVRPEDPAPRRDLVKFYLSSESPTRAIPHLQWLDAREQNSPAYAAELARQAAMVEDWALAHDKAERATRIAPFDAEMRELAAAMAIKAGRPGDARRHILALITLEPDREIHARRLKALEALEGGG
ncbi:MAG: hypothetical protein IT439_02595 [Phycisphaerales bacterium]|nr:hypothetical protein [Phycisphaerales bacterium]